MADVLNQQIVFRNDKNQENVQDGCCSRRYRARMDTLGSRLRSAREAAGLTQAELAERVGMAGQSSIEAIESGRSKNPTRIHEIAKACGVTVEWLQGREEGAPLKARPKALEPSSRTAGKTIPEIDLRGGASYGGGIADADWNRGDGWSGDEPVEQWGLPSAYVQRELGLQFGFAEIIQVRGDSMDDGTAKGLASGDRVVIDRRDTDTRQGGIFAVFDGEGVIIKQVELLRGHEPARIVCKSRNQSYDPITLEMDGRVRVIGRVAAVISRR